MSNILAVRHGFFAVCLGFGLLGQSCRVNAQGERYVSLETLVADDRAGRATLPRPLRSPITLALRSVTLAKALDTLTSLTGIGIAYTDELARASVVSLDARNRRAADVIVSLLRSSGWIALADAQGQVVIRRAPTPRPRPGGDRVRLSGYIRNAANGELIRYATIIAPDDSARVTTNADGYFVIAVSRGEQPIRVRAIGYVPLDTVLQLSDSRTTEFVLSARTVELQKVTVDGSAQRSDTDPQTPEMSVVRLDLATIRKAPAALGEVDPVRSLTLLPGVSRASDFSTAFNVRGGSTDQNLILLDEATIYNAAHILGFLSVFNSDAVADVTLYKGAIPPRFGGRLSSVLDVRQREGDAKRFGGSASLGLLSSRASVEGPLGIGRGSFLITGRRSYADVFIGASSDSTLRENKAWFYDLNAKTNVRLGASGALMASGYVGRDVFTPSGDFGANWGNLSGTIRWNQIINNRLFSKVSITSADYDYGLRFSVLETKAKWVSRIKSQELRVEERFFLTPKQSLEFGAELAGHVIRPGQFTPRDTSRLRGVFVQPRNGQAAAGYVGHTVDVGERFSMSYGARYSRYERVGPGTLYRYVGGNPVVWNVPLQRFEPARLRDSVRYAEGQSLAQFGGWEPRISLRAGLTDHSSLKASYARTRQYLQLASRTNSPSPLDVWEPVGPYFKPQYADQAALGYFHATPNNAWEMSAEAWGKRLYHLIDFIEGSDVVLNPRLETALVSGIGRARGLELFARKQSGSVTGWVSYTWSKSEQLFRVPGGGGINGGRWYPSPADKTHDLSIVGFKSLGPRWTLGSTFSLASGLPVTYPVSRYVVDDLVVPQFGGRNASRLPTYHRLDLALTRTSKRGEFQFGVFNVYNRFNAQSMSFRQAVSNPVRTEAVQLSVFGIVPSFSYTFRF